MEQDWDQLNVYGAGEEQGPGIHAQGNFSLSITVEDRLAQLPLLGPIRYTSDIERRQVDSGIAQRRICGKVDHRSIILLMESTIP